MNDLITIHGTEISIKEYHGQRVVTFKDIDAVHGRPEGTALRNFNANRERFVEGEDYFIVSSDEIRRNGIFTISENDHRDKALITEQGYLMLVKSLNDEMAWTVQRQLVKGYFRTQINMSALSPQTQLLMTMAEQIAMSELRQKEQAEKIEAIEDKVSTMQDILTEPLGDWKNDINKRVREISMKSGIDYQSVYGEMYGQLELKAHCSLSRLQENKKARMEKAGNTKAAIKEGTTKIAIIYEKPQLKEIFETIVKNWAVKYCI